MSAVGLLLIFEKFFLCTFDRKRSTSQTFQDLMNPGIHFSTHKCPHYNERGTASSEPRPEDHSLKSL